MQSNGLNKAISLRLQPDPKKILLDVLDSAERLIARSRATREAYLALIRGAAGDGPQRGKALRIVSPTRMPRERPTQLTSSEWVRRVWI